MARRKEKVKKLSDALAGLTLIVLAMLWLQTGNLALIIRLFFGLIIIIIGLGLFLHFCRKRKLLASGINEIDNMSGEEFEQLLLEYFIGLGYRGKITDRFADYGADLLLVKDNVRYVVQAKRWKQKVGVKGIQEVVASIKHYKADKGFVITNSYFTDNAVSLAISNGIELWDRNKLIDVMSQVKAGETAGITNNISKNIPKSDDCPRCGSKLVVRNGSRGKFIGCSGFPKCRYSRDYMESNA